MTTTQNPAPAPIYTVWTKPIYLESNEVWSGEDFTEALKAGIAQIGDDVAEPLDHTAVGSLREVGGTPVQAWRVKDAESWYRVVYITR
jgi:hypothetical protein